MTDMPPNPAILGSSLDAMKEDVQMTLSVIVVTFRREWHLEMCLRSLNTQRTQVTEVVVVDSCPDQSARILCEGASVTYVHNPSGIGHMTESRNLGIAVASGDVVAFIDDDSFPAPDWSNWILDPFRQLDVGGVGGRAIGNPAQMPAPISDQIGRVTGRGELVANFEVDPGHPMDVQHVIGCNMAFRRSVLESFGGFRADYPGTALREETDLCFRLIAAGRRLVYEPRALVVHVGAPHARGARFDLRYQYYARRNHLQLLVRNVGFHKLTRRWLVVTLSDACKGLVRDLVAAPVRFTAAVAALGAGVVAGCRVRSADRRRRQGNERSRKDLGRVLARDEHL